MLKRLMIWLLNQIQKQFRKIAGFLNGGRDSARSHPPAKDPTSANRSSETAQPSLTRSDINIDTVAPIAQRVSLAPAIPKKEQQQDSESSPYDATANPATIGTDTSEPNATESDAISSATTPNAVNSEREVVEKPNTHKRLDVTAAAISGQESIRPTIPTAVSKLIASDTPPQPSFDADLPAPTTQTQGNYQLPTIHDLLPAIELEEPIHSEESIHSEASSYIEEEMGYAEEEPAYETIAVSDDPEVIESVAVEPAAEESPTADSSYAEIAKEVVEQATIFSFDIYENELVITDKVEDTDELEIVQESEAVSEGEDVSSAGASTAIAVAEGDSMPVSEAEDLEDLSIDTSSNSIDEEPTGEESATEESTEEPTTEELAAEDSVTEELITEELATEELDSETQSGNEPLVEEKVYIFEYTVISESEDESTSLELADSLKVADSPEVSKPVNPWSTAISRKATASTRPIPAADAETALGESVETETVETETKPGIVKLLFTIKPGNYHGYIAPADGSKDILFHQKYINADIFKKIERGTPVVATVKLVEGKAYATHVELSSPESNGPL